MIVQAPIPTTLTDSEGDIYGYLDNEGTPIAVGQSNVGRTVMVWDDVLKKKVPMEVTWDGAAPKLEGLGKGELQAHPTDLPRIHRQLGGPRYKPVASWGPRTLQAGEEFDAQEQE